MKTILATLGISALVGVLAALAFIYSGIFNVAATVEDAPLLRWVFITTREASIKRHARDIRAPAPSGPEQMESGFRLYRQECAMCHTPPGRQARMMAKGLNPQAPELADLIDMTDAEVFWVIKNGIRFTGMPAWVTSENGQKIWDVVAFLRMSSKMEAADYDALDRRVPPRQPMNEQGSDPGNRPAQGPAASSTTQSTRTKSP
jgi:mono/diheme cytochrome c family protein